MLVANRVLRGYCIGKIGIRCFIIETSRATLNSISPTVRRQSDIATCDTDRKSSVPRRKYSIESSIWDDSDWMKQDDSNQKAFETLDITKLKPFPEFRNVATGPVWPDDAFNLIWNKYYEEQTPLQYVGRHNNEWKEFLESKGFEPCDYFESDEYTEKYGERLVWADFRRNHKGSRQKQTTRHACFFRGKMCGNPCPLCRDDNLLLNFKNITLLNHFIDPHSGKVYHPLRTGVCRRKQKLLEHTIVLARDQGLIPTPVSNYEDFNESDYRVDHLAVRPISQ